MENKRNFIDVIKRIKANNSNYSLKDISTILVLIILWIALSTISDNFFTIGNFNNILLQSANVMLVSVGMTFIIICGHIDLSVGSIEAFAGAVIAVLVINYKLPLWLSLVLGLGVGLLCGTVSGFLVAKLRFPAFVATLGMDSIARGLALLTTGGQAVFGFPEAFKFIGQGYVGIPFIGIRIPFPVIIAFITIITAHILLKYTVFGTNVYATGGNQEAAVFSGVNIKKIQMYVFLIAGVLSALGGIIMTSRLNPGQATIGAADGMDAIAAVVIGGTSMTGGKGSIIGTVIGVLIVSSIKNGLNILGVSAYWQQVFIGVIIILAVLIDQLGKKKSVTG